jgi:hypothetical protein
MRSSLGVIGLLLSAVAELPLHEFATDLDEVMEELLLLGGAQRRPGRP